MNGEFRPQMILFGRQLGDRHGKQRFGPSPRQAIRPLVDGRNDKQGNQGCGQEPQRENHDGFDHADTNSRLLLD